MRSTFSRRTLLSGAAAAATLAALTACTGSSGSARVLPSDRRIQKTKDARPSTGKTVPVELTAGSIAATVAGRHLSTWGYNGALIAPTVRANVGDQIEARITNRLAEPTSIHWHGISLRNNADGVPGLTQTAIAAGGTKQTVFKLSAPGTYWYHSHVEMQRERALYGALIVDDPEEPLAYDQEWVIILDDWIDGFAGTPDSIVKELSQGMSMSGMQGMNMSGSSMLMNSKSAYLGGDAGDVKVPVHLINGRSNSDPDRLITKMGNRVRLRLINAAGDTAYRVGIPHRRLRLTHTDGFPIEHRDVDAVVIGMGERIDALVTVNDAIAALLALPEGKTGSVFAVMSTGSVSNSTRLAAPSRLGPDVTDGGRLNAAPSALLRNTAVDRTHDLRLTGSMSKYGWGINGRTFNLSDPFGEAFEIRAGERVRINFINETTMWHPMHLHGHTFQVGKRGPRKDTIIVRPKQRVTVDFDADNPGQWLAHCHNAYHAERGMMGVFSYVT